MARLVFGLFVMVVTASAQHMEDLDDILVYPLEAPKNIEKRETLKKMDDEQSAKFIEDKLIEHGQALEQLLEMVNRNEELTKQLLSILSSKLEAPKLPEKLEFMSRRSFNDPPVTVPSIGIPQKVSPWCIAAVLCQRKLDPVCGFDDNFGFGKFDDLCHMIQVNCYWKYNFALVPSCKPSK